MRSLAHKIGEETSSSETIDSSLFHEVARSCPLPCFLPQLQELEITVPGMFVSTQPILLFSPTLVKLDFRVKYNFAQNSVEFATAVQAMGRLTKMKDLRIQGNLGSSSAVDSLCSSMMKMKELQAFEFEAHVGIGIARYFLRCLSSLNYLRHLRIKIRMPFWPEIHHIPREAINFPSLVTLEVTLEFLEPDPIPALQEFLSDCEFEQLSALTLTVAGGSCKPEDYKVIFTNIADACPTLQTLIARFPEADHRHIDVTTVTPVLTARHPLRILNLHQNGPIYRAPSDIEMLATALGSSITELFLTHAGNLPRDEPPPSLTSLALFAQHCPHLKTLTISLDATLSHVPQLPEEKIRFHSLEKLHLEDSPIQDPYPVAFYLHHLGCPLAYPHRISPSSDFKTWVILVVVMDCAKNLRNPCEEIMQALCQEVQGSLNKANQACLTTPA